MLEAAAK